MLQNHFNNAGNNRKATPSPTEDFSSAARLSFCQLWIQSQSNACIQKAIPGCQGTASRCIARGAGEKPLCISGAPPAPCCMFRNGLLGGVLYIVMKWPLNTFGRTVCDSLTTVPLDSVLRGPDIFVGRYIQIVCSSSVSLMQRDSRHPEGQVLGRRTIPRPMHSVCTDMSFGQTPSFAASPSRQRGFPQCSEKPLQERFQQSRRSFLRLLVGGGNGCSSSS